jgi:hypothetical protein
MNTKIQISVILIMALTLICSACYYDDPPEIAPIDIEDVSFSTHILPTFEASCATSNCHDGTREPNLINSLAYSELVGGGYINIAIPEESILYKSVDFQSGVDAMPPGGPKLPNTDIEVIRLWIIKGAPNN